MPKTHRRDAAFQIESIARDGITPKSHREISIRSINEKSVGENGKIEAVPFQLHRAAAYLRSPAMGDDQFWWPCPTVTSFRLFSLESIRLGFAIAGHMSLDRRLIEPPDEARLIRALPSQKKKTRRKEKGKGLMSAQSAPAGRVEGGPAILLAGEGQPVPDMQPNGGPVIEEIVGEDGDVDS